MENLISVDKLHEECGVFGIYAPEGENVAEDIYCGLTALQHRGQESAGMSVSDTGSPEINLITKKGMGLVSEVFDKKILEALRGMRVSAMCAIPPPVRALSRTPNPLP